MTGRAAAVAAALPLVGVAASCDTGARDRAEPLGAASQGLTCTTFQRTSPLVQGGVQDTQILMDFADPTKANTSFGAVSMLKTGYSGTSYSRVLLRFDLASIPAGAAVSSASLTFRMVQSLGKQPVELHRITAPWSEGSATWNSFALAFDPAVELSVPTLGVPNNSNLTVDLTSLVAAWVAGTTPNHGVLFDHPAAGRTSVGASEAPTLGVRPKLSVCYTAPTCSDGVQNGGETGVDCGGPCAASCCAHDTCTVGSALDPATCSDPCVQQVCGVEPLCCSDDWDATCVGLVANACGSACSTCLHDTCTIGGALDPSSCSDPCVAQICANDPFCCSSTWDASCVGQVSALCGSSACVCGNGVCSGSENCTTCPTDCGVCVNCPHGPCVTGAPLNTTACSDPCILAMCAADPYCCDTTWDSFCVIEVDFVCGPAVCP
jgi:hypothetical protein